MTKPAFYKPKRIAKECEMTPVSLRAYHGFGLKSEGPITGDGDGMRRHYTFADGVAVAVMNRLVQHAIGRRHAADIVNDSRRHFNGRFWLAIFPGTAPGWRGGNKPAELSRLMTEPRPDGSMPTEIVVIAVHEIAADLRRKLDEPIK